MLGSVFSPYYARARRRGAADPLDHCAFNAALYGPGGHRWAMTERGRGGLRRGATELAIGPSRLDWDGHTLVARIDEVTVPFPSRLRGEVRLKPEGIVREAFALDAHGRHAWHPWAPCARVDVALERPALRWSGRAYLDSNRGTEPLEDAFAGWQWSRGTLSDGSTAVLYDVSPHGDGAPPLALRLTPEGEVRRFESPRPAPLPATRWRIARATRADEPARARVLKTLEDTPFYARSVVSAAWLGEPVTAVHESLSLERFRRRWVQWMLPFRMPRRRR